MAESRPAACRESESKKMGRVGRRCGGVGTAPVNAFRWRGWYLAMSSCAWSRANCTVFRICDCWVALRTGLDFFSRMPLGRSPVWVAADAIVWNWMFRKAQRKAAENVDFKLDDAWETVCLSRRSETKHLHRKIDCMAISKVASTFFCGRAGDASTLPLGSVVPACHSTVLLAIPLTGMRLYYSGKGSPRSHRDIFVLLGIYTIFSAGSLVDPVLNCMSLNKPLLLFWTWLRISNVTFKDSGFRVQDGGASSSNHSWKAADVSREFHEIKTVQSKNLLL
jgi:hypothetical protein